MLLTFILYLARRCNPNMKGMLASTASISSEITLVPIIGMRMVIESNEFWRSLPNSYL